MKAQLLKDVSLVENRPLELVEMPVPQPKAEEILVLSCRNRRYMLADCLPSIAHSCESRNPC